VTPVPFDPLMWDNTVRIVRVSRVMVGGVEVKTWPGPPGPPIACTVRTRTESREDAASRRVTVVTIWMVRTPTNPGMNPDDMFLFTDSSGSPKRIVAEGPSMTRGDGTSYLTECAERK
jgi:hypothetical protein